MTTYFVTGGTGLMGRHVVERLTQLPGAGVYVLVRAGSVERLLARTERWEHGDRVIPVLGDLTAEGLGLSPEDREALGGVDHVVHMAAVYDLTADEERTRRANVDGTRFALDLAASLRARCFHHVSSVVVAGDHVGAFTEDMFDVGQRLGVAYQRTKFEAERIVRGSDLPHRIYRPSVVVGDSRTGEMDKVDGPYYALPALAAIGGIPGAYRLRLPAPQVGRINIVPVDWLADATVALMHRPGLDGRTFHLTDPENITLVEVMDAFARAAGAPRMNVAVPAAIGDLVADVANAAAKWLPKRDELAKAVVERLGIPPEGLDLGTFSFTVRNDATLAELAAAGLGPPPRFRSYAANLYRYWAQHMDPLRARRRRYGGPLQDRVIVVTGASSGIGRATALQVAQRGGIPIVLARRAEELALLCKEIEEAGGRAYAYPVDLTDAEALDAVVARILGDHGHVDMLVNNAARSIRRSFVASQGRFHDYERSMDLNFYAQVRLIQALVPSMVKRQFGHIVNISSIGVQARPPRFSAYVASKAALDGFTKVVAGELIGDGVTFSTVYMPLVHTPMSAPTEHYRKMKGLTPEQAAAMVIEALEKQPARVGTKLGTALQAMEAVAPRLMKAVHYAYDAFPDSADGRRGETLSRTARAIARLAPGVHW